METSSPLAAMHRSAAPAFGKRDIFANIRVRMSPGKPSMGGRLSIRDQLNQEAFGPIHGSSPAGSLAADLCQNFTIGENDSPRFPTPRRALFTSGHGVADRRAFIKAPPLPVSSSPLPVEDLMEMTPVAKKTVSFISGATLGSPSPASSSSDDMMLEASPCPGQQPAAIEPSRPPSSGLERRKPLRRPSLTRTKGYSFAGPSGRMHTENQLPFFRFGGTESRLPPAPPSSLSLSECFQESPPQASTSSQTTADHRPQSANSPCANLATGPLRSRPSFLSMGGPAAAVAAQTGSPLHGHSHATRGHIRRTSSTFVRPRRQYRRSLSMYESPGDMIKPKREDAGLQSSVVPTLQPSLLASVMDTDESSSSEPVLPHFFPEGQNDSIPRIDRATMLSVLDGQYNDKFENKLIVDCRFEYEYEGGHINEAVNYNDKELLANHLFRTPMEGRTLIVLHCEYSAHRAPLMARHIRAEDRTANMEHYPRLSYPELYILEGGYSGFFGEHPSRCYPQAYVEMDAAEHAFTCEREMGRLRQTRKGLHRAQTFAFGQKERQERVQPQQPVRPYEFNDVSSPTAPGRQISFSSQQSPCMMMGASPILGSDRRHARRMASY